MDEICMVLLARACGNGVFRPNAAEKSVFGVQKTSKFVDFLSKSENLHEMGREKTFLNFEEWNRCSFLARISL